MSASRRRCLKREVVACRQVFPGARGGYKAETRSSPVLRLDYRAMCVPAAAHIEHHSVCGASDDVLSTRAVEDVRVPPDSASFFGLVPPAARMALLRVGAGPGFWAHLTWTRSRACWRKISTFSWCSSSLFFAFVARSRSAQPPAAEWSATGRRLQLQTRFCMMAI